MLTSSFWPAATEPDPTPSRAGWIFEDPHSKALLAQIDKVAPSDASALISGKSGTGKELIARYIHARSLLRHHPFVAVTCGSMSEALVDVELFGHENGAFAGAFGVQRSRFEDANLGTLYLDEINDLPLLAQTKLLRVLKDREVVRLGRQKGIPVDVRILASSTVDLETLVARGKFREDLYYHLNVVNLEIRPLRERRGDIIPLARHFIEEYSSQLNYAGASLTEKAERALVNYPWPGNVRELENVIHRTLLMLDGGAIDRDDLRFPVRQANVWHFPGQRAANAATEESGVYALRQAVRKLCEERADNLYQLIENTAVKEVLRYCDDNQSETARLLGVNRSVVRARIARSGDDKVERRLDSDTWGDGGRDDA